MTYSFIVELMYHYGPGSAPVIRTGGSGEKSWSKEMNCPGISAGKVARERCSTGAMELLQIERWGSTKPVG